MMRLSLPFAAALLYAQTASDIDILISAGRLGEAETAARANAKAHPDSADAHFLLGYVFFKQNKPDRSLAEYREGALYATPDAADLEVIGGDYFLMEDYAAADKYLTESVAKNPRDPLALYLLGRTRYNRKHFEEAADLFTKCLAVDPKNEKAEFNLGLAYEQLGRTADAIAAYKLAINLQPTDAAANLQLGTLLGNQGLHYLADAARLSPQDAKAHRELGKAYLATGDLDAAQHAVERSLELDPQSGPSHLLLAQIYRKRGQTDKAQQQMSRYSELTGNHSVAGDPLAEARALSSAGKWNDAEQVLRRYLQLHKDSADAHYLLGYALFKQQKATESLAQYTEGARFRTPGSLDLETVGADYVLLGDYTDADKWFSKSVEFDPNNSQALYYLGRTKYSEGLFSDAADVFLKCLTQDPSNAAAHRELARTYTELKRFSEAQHENERYAALAGKSQ